MQVPETFAARLLKIKERVTDLCRYPGFNEK